jgi:hypothetical protein
MGIFCLFYQNKLAALASQELPEGLASRVERHLSGCPDCLSEWAAQERMASCLRGASPEAQSPSPFLWERLEAAIQAEAPLREQAPAAPTPSPFRRLAPLGGLALAGAAAAAVFVVRAPQKAAAPPPSVQAPVVIAKLSPTPEPLPSPTPKPVTAVELAQQSEKIDPPKPPQISPDPFRKQRPAAMGNTRRPLSSLPRVAQFTRRKRLPEPIERETEISAPTQRHAVAVMEVGMHRITEEAQTAELNRQVTETERNELGASQRAAFAPTDAMSNAQHTRSLFQ